MRRGSSPSRWRTAALLALVALLGPACIGGDDGGESDDSENDVGPVNDDPADGNGPNADDADDEPADDADDDAGDADVAGEVVPVALTVRQPVVVLGEGDEAYRTGLCELELVGAIEEGASLADVAAMIRAVPAPSPAAADEREELARRLERIDLEATAVDVAEIAVVGDVLATRCEDYRIPETVRAEQAAAIEASGGGSGDVGPPFDDPSDDADEPDVAGTDDGASVDQSREPADGDDDDNTSEDDGFSPEPAEGALARGVGGPRVRALQEGLVAVGYLDPGDVDGLFGPGTESAVRALQRDEGLAVDGIAGPATHAALGLPYQGLSGLRAWARAPGIDIAPRQDPFSFPDDIVDLNAPINGCGSQGPDGTDVPDAPVFVSFTDACNWHDQCYGTKGLSRYYCDLGMLWRSLGACNEYDPLELLGCRRVAVIYYYAVRRLGGEPYAKGQEEACARNPTRHARTHGDPHVVTLDGLRYGFQAAGEFTLVETTDGDDVIQARFLPRSDTFTVPTGVAVAVGDQHVSIQYGDDGTVLAVVDGETAAVEDIVHLDGGFITFGVDTAGTDGSVVIRRTDGVMVHVMVQYNRIDLTIDVPVALGDVAGLLGNGNGDDSDDLIVGDTIVGAADVYGDFKEAWRVEPARSMFTALPGEVDYHDDDLLRYPIEAVQLDDFPDADADAARATCRERGVGDDDVDACAFDVVASGDAQAADAAARSSERWVRQADPAQRRLVDAPPLVIAAAAGDLDTTRSLLLAGADPDVGRASDRATPVAFAAQDGYTDVVELLLDFGARPDLQVEGGLTALLLAAQNGHIDVVESLIAAGASPNVAAGESTPIGQAAQNGHTAIVDRLLAAGSSTWPHSGLSRPPLWSAAQNGHPDIARALIGAGADPHVSHDGRSAVSTAVRNGHLAVLVALLEAGADPDVGDGTPVMVTAVFAGEPEIVRVLLEADADVDRADPDGFTALIVAAQEDDADVARLLLEAGADPNLATERGWTPLHAAAGADAVAIAIELIAAGADPARADDRGARPIDFAESPEMTAALS